VPWFELACGGVPDGLMFHGGATMPDPKVLGQTRRHFPRIAAITDRLVSEYLAGANRLPDVVLFRMRADSPYREATLAHDVAAVRAIVFPGDQRTLMDMRRSGTIEAVAGGADAVGMAAKMANSIGQSNALHKDYSPVSIEPVRNTDAARLKGRRKMRAENGKRRLMGEVK
jgi:hypothetical protein